MSKVLNLRQKLNEKFIREVANTTTDQFFLKAYNYSYSEVLGMRDVMAEHDYESKALDELCGMAHKQIHGNWSTMQPCEVIRAYEKLQIHQEE